MSIAKQIEAGCEKFNTIDSAARNRKEREGGYWTKEEVAAQKAAKEELVATLKAAGFYKANEWGSEFESPKHGRVKFSDGEYGVRFTPAASLRAKAQKNAIRSAAAYQEARY